LKYSPLTNAKTSPIVAAPLPKPHGEIELRAIRHHDLRASAGTVGG
jgi:hypothetical protein